MDPERLRRGREEEGEGDAKGEGTLGSFEPLEDALHRGRAVPRRTADALKGPADEEDEGNEPDDLEEDHRNGEGIERPASEAVQAHDETEDREGDQVVRQRDGDDRPPEAAVEQIQVEQDAHAHGQGGHGHRRGQEERVRDIEAQRGGERVPEEEREDEFHRGDDGAPLLEGLSEALPPELHPRQ